MSQEYTPVDWVDETPNTPGTLINKARLDQMQTAHHYADGFEEVDAVPTADPGVDYHKVVFCTADTTFYRWDGSAWVKDVDDTTKALLEAHEADHANPHVVTKAQVGLGNCDNTSDADKPVSTAQQTALDGKVAIIPVTSGVKFYSQSSGGTSLYQGTSSPVTGITSVPLRDSSGRVKTSAPSADDDTANKKYVDDADALKLNISAKVSAWQGTPDNDHIPTEKLVKDSLGDGSVTKIGTANVGGDLKPIKLVGGVPTAVTNDLMDLATEQTVTASKTYTNLQRFGQLRLATLREQTIGSGTSGSWRVMGKVVLTSGQNVRAKILALSNQSNRMAVGEAYIGYTSAKVEIYATSSFDAENIAINYDGAGNAIILMKTLYVYQSPRLFPIYVQKTDIVDSTAIDYSDTTTYSDVASFPYANTTYGTYTNLRLNTVTEATGTFSMQAANSNKVKNELDNYAPMVRTTGNQTIAGIKTFTSTPYTLIDSPDGVSIHLRNNNLTLADQTGGHNTSIAIRGASDALLARLRYRNGVMDSLPTRNFQVDLYDSSGTAHVFELCRLQNGVEYGPVLTTGAQTIAGAKTFSDNVTISKGTPTFILQDGVDITNTTPASNRYLSLDFRDKNGTSEASIFLGHYTNGAKDMAFNLVSENGSTANLHLFNTQAGTGYMTGPSRAYNASNTSDIVNISLLDAYTPMVRTTGNQRISGVKSAESFIKTSCHLRVTGTSKYEICRTGAVTDTTIYLLIHSRSNGSVMGRVTYTLNDDNTAITGFSKSFIGDATGSQTGKLYIHLEDGNIVLSIGNSSSMNNYFSVVLMGCYNGAGLDRFLDTDYYGRSTTSLVDANMSVVISS